MLGAGGVSGVRRGGWRVRGGVGRSVAQRSPAGLVGSGGVVSGLDVETVVALLEVMQRGGMDAALDLAELLDAPEQHVLALRLHAELLAVKVAFYDGELARAAFLGQVRPGVTPEAAAASLTPLERAQWETLGGGDW